MHHRPDPKEMNVVQELINPLDPIFIFAILLLISHFLIFYSLFNLLKMRLSFSEVGSPIHL